jgi:DNA-binding CsgD family transcriptional regulator
MIAANALIDLIDRFTEAQSFEDRWSTARTCFQDLGGVDLNLAEFSIGRGEVHWLSSSMPQHWLNRYVAREYFKDDSIAQHGLKSTDLQTYDIGWARKTDWASAGARHIDDDLADLGYGGALAQTFDRPDANTRVAVTMMSETAASGFADPDTHRMFTRTAATISAFIGRPQPASDIPYFQPPALTLTVRERDVLSYVASGANYQQIAEKLRITQSTVQLHANSARQRLKASTRDQAVALAIRDGLIEI